MNACSSAQARTHKGYSLTSPATDVDLNFLCTDKMSLLVPFVCILFPP